MKAYKSYIEVRMHSYTIDCPRKRRQCVLSGSIHIYSSAFVRDQSVLFCKIQSVIYFLLKEHIITY
jgi:hypothetical protein